VTIQPLLEDAARFLRFSFEPINQHPLETYDSALAWIPKKSLMRERYADTFHGLPQVVYGLTDSWEPALHVLRHSGTVTSVAFSSDGSRIVSGSWNNGSQSCNIAVQDWNTVSGMKESKYTLTQEEEGEHISTGEESELESDLEERATYVAVSPDGSRIASGSYDQIVRVWNAATGDLEAQLKGHTDEVTSVTFSHNARFIVSGSEDGTARVWNMTTYKTEHLLSDHSCGVTSVAMFGNDKYIVSGSDEIVRIWNIATGQLCWELTGAVDWECVTSVTVSSGSRCIAAACPSAI
jgi:WD40 repeat protein